MSEVERLSDGSTRLRVVQHPPLAKGLPYRYAVHDYKTGEDVFSPTTDHRLAVRYCTFGNHPTDLSPLHEIAGECARQLALSMEEVRTA